MCRPATEAPLLCCCPQRMHALAIIHRDVKLENVFLGAAGDLRLGDFGLTMSMKQESAISPVGTVEYMAPEVGAFEGCHHNDRSDLLFQKVLGQPGVCLHSTLQGHPQCCRE